MNSVLIVEDEKHLADGLRYNLKAEGYDVETAGTGEEALALLVDGRKSYDVVVLDVMLPGIDGFSLASQIALAGTVRSDSDVDSAWTIGRCVARV